MAQPNITNEATQHHRSNQHTKDSTHRPDIIITMFSLFNAFVIVIAFVTSLGNERDDSPKAPSDREFQQLYDAWVAMQRERTGGY